MREEMRKLLIVEDDPKIQKQLRWYFDGYQVLMAGNREEALGQMQRHRPAIVTLDLGLPPDEAGVDEGLTTLRLILHEAPETKVIVVTGNHDRANGVRAIGLGAYDFYAKPIEGTMLRTIVDRACYVHELEIENRRLLRDQIMTRDGIIGASPEMRKVCQAMERVAASNASVLLLGDSGTGKELCARAVHDLSARRQGRFVAINCAAIPENLLESELFGHEKGAFSGAVKQTRGKIECADSGTLFLDELGDLPMSLQAKLLRFLQERVIERVGGRVEIPVDVRVICATHQDLYSKMENGTFREDLFYRISEITIKIPPLRERKGDVLLMAQTFLEQFSREQGRQLRGFSPDALAALEAHHWPGNVRELKNRINRAIVMAEGKQVTAADLELAKGSEQESSFSLQEAREQAEKHALLRALGHAGGQISHAAQLLGVSRPTVYDLVRKLRLRV